MKFQKPCPLHISDMLLPFQLFVSLVLSMTVNLFNYVSNTRTATEELCCWSYSFVFNIMVQLDETHTGYLCPNFGCGFPREFFLVIICRLHLSLQKKRGNNEFVI